MIGIDTNLLVRYITQDGNEAPRATECLERECRADQPGFLCTVVLCELVWVLQRAYKYDRASVVAILAKLLSTAEFEVEHAACAWRALAEYRTGSADFADYLIGQIAAESETVPVLTLDRKAAQNEHFRLI